MTGRPSVWFPELSWDAIAACLSGDGVTLMPIDATEQHGHFASTMLDTAWVITVAEEAAQRAGCLFAPPLRYGWSSGHMAYLGYIGLRAETLTAVAIDSLNQSCIRASTAFCCSTATDLPIWLPWRLGR